LESTAEIEFIQKMPGQQKMTFPPKISPL
jgi:hypothetical protein